MQRALGGFSDEAKDAAKGTGEATVSTSAFGVALGNLASNQMQRALDVLQFKLDILWAMNDAMANRYGVSA